MGRCSSILTPSGILEPFDGNKRAEIERIKDAWSCEGKRVILLARKVLKGGEIQIDPSDGLFEQETLDQAKTELVLISVLGIVDPPRDEIPEVVRTLRGAGIRIFMVTGDFKLTAQAIAKDCGIIISPKDQIHGSGNLLRKLGQASENANQISPSSPRSLVISGPELMVLNDTQWEQLCQYDEVVFARTTPEQKLRIVKEYQARDNLVGMTGDGINDAPSLKQADIGIAPGSGSDIAIEAADMVLLDSFSTIVQAVMYGRVVFDNLKKIICYLLPAGSYSELWPIMTNVVFSLPQILSSFLMYVFPTPSSIPVLITILL